MPRDSVHVEQEELEGLVLGADLHDGVVLTDPGDGAELGEDDGLGLRLRHLDDLGVVATAVEQVGSFRLPPAVVLDQLAPQVPPHAERRIVAHLGAVDGQLVPDPDVGHLGPALGGQVAGVVAGEVGEAVLGEVGAETEFDHVFLEVLVVSVGPHQQAPEVVSIELERFLGGLGPRELQGDRRSHGEERGGLVLGLLAPGGHGLVAAPIGLLGVEGGEAQLLLRSVHVDDEGVTVDDAGDRCLEGGPLLRCHAEPP